MQLLYTLRYPDSDGIRGILNFKGEATIGNWMGENGRAVIVNTDSAEYGCIARLRDGKLVYETQSALLGSQFTYVKYGFAAFRGNPALLDAIAPLAVREPVQAIDKIVNSRDYSNIRGELGQKINSIFSLVDHFAASDCGLNTPAEPTRFLFGRDAEETFRSLQFLPPRAGVDGGSIKYAAGPNGYALHVRGRADKAGRYDEAQIRQECGGFSSITITRMGEPEETHILNPYRPEEEAYYEEPIRPTHLRSAHLAIGEVLRDLSGRVPADRWTISFPPKPV